MDAVRRVFNEGEQGAFIASRLKPTMCRAVDLNQFADVFAAIPRLMRGSLAVSAQCLPRDAAIVLFT